MDYSKHFSKKSTPQTRPIPAKPMIANNAGGYTFQVGDMERVRRFLILGSEGGTYYVSEQKLTVENAKHLTKCLKSDKGVAIVEEIVSISKSGKAAKNDPAIFALALACTVGNAETKQAAYRAVFDVCRTGTHLFQFCQNIQNMRGWSRGLRSAVGRFYTDRSAEDLAYQLMKYRQRDGWTHRDVLRLSHPEPRSAQKSLFAYAVGKHADGGDSRIAAMNELQTLDKKDFATAAKIIFDEELPRECVPTEFLSNRGVWASLLVNMPMHAMLRNLGKMTNVGLLGSNFDDTVKQLAAEFGNAERIRKSRLHPLAILNALRVYQQGHGDKGSLSWTPVSMICDALDEAFYMAFDNVESTGKNIVLGLDVSGSMGMGRIAGTALTPREASCALAMVTARKETCVILAFGTTIQPLNISPKARLSDVVAATSRIPFGGTDCSVPIEVAIRQKLPADAFVIYTDNQTYAGRRHPAQALAEFRKKQNKPEARMVVVGMQSTAFTIADPNDCNMLDVAGFSTETPTLISEFIAGRI